ncbi:MAG: GIY-YIG nuclease family protein [Taibaiella sp.]|nr:GIY-YIG nuclease family protein [Taibaiella sp.]
MYGSWVRVPTESQSPANAGLFYFITFVYILYSPKLNKYYVGECSNLERRIYEHTIGHSAFRSTGVPWELKYAEQLFL